MKVKIFRVTGQSLFNRKTLTTGEILENQVNDWLANNTGLKIIKIKQSCCGGSLEPSITLISVWYEN
ncbi:MAG: hypothetical protein WB996_09985 [Ignavibacteriaceae bacterium]